MTDIPAIATQSLSKCYRGLNAVSDLNLNVRRGVVTGFLGRNGAGKSTTLKMLLGIVHPTSGQACILGVPVSDAVQAAAMRKHVAYVSEDKRLYEYMTVDETIRFFRSFYPDWQTDLGIKLLREYGLPADRKVRALSKGMRTKLALLIAFARKADVVILDEPSEGLDPVGIEDLLESISRLARDGATVFFSSHQLAEVERVADSICIIEKGRLLLSGELRETRALYTAVTFADTAGEPEFQFLSPSIRTVKRYGGATTLLVNGDPERVIEEVRKSHPANIDVAPASLQQIFLHLIGEN